VVEAVDAICVSSCFGVRDYAVSALT
jgi:hypothetical protein